MKIYIDGKFYDRQDAKISVFDHGLLYGDGVFEGLRIYNGKVFLLEEHLNRLFMSAKAIMLDVGISIKQMSEAVNETVRINERDKPGKSGYIRLVVTRGEGQLGIDPGSCEKASVIIITEDLKLYPQKYYDEGVKLVTSSVRRNRMDSLDPRIKSLNYLNNIMAKIEAKNSGAVEAVVLNDRGYVAECTADNIFIINNGVVSTPLVTDGALKGITRGFVCSEVCSGLGLGVEERSMALYDLYNADECFLTGSGAEVVPAVSIDGRLIGDGKPGKFTIQIAKEFSRMVNSF
ncbi:MAG TPA: branched-chain-amino-acid transaminase [Spirochaetota bacterium]|nr:branched-chain-amino-acid transaminase [Spirochaetota bacterium]